MKQKNFLMALCVLSVETLSCSNAQKAHISDSATDTASTIVTADVGRVSESSAAEDEDLSQLYKVNYEGTIGTDKVLMSIIDTENGLDENGSMWERMGTITFKETGKSFKLKGYCRQLNLFLDAVDENGNKVGHFESIEEDELDGTYENLLDGKTYKAIFKIIE